MSGVPNRRRAAVPRGPWSRHEPPPTLEELWRARLDEELEDDDCPICRALDELRAAGLVEVVSDGPAGRIELVHPGFMPRPGGVAS